MIHSQVRIAHRLVNISTEFTNQEPFEFEYRKKSRITLFTQKIKTTFKTILHKQVKSSPTASKYKQTLILCSNMVRNFLLLSTSIFFLFRETASFVPRKLHTQAFTTISQASARSTHLAVHDLAGKNNPSFSQKHYDSSELESQGIDNANFILSGIRSLQGSYAPNKSSTKVYNEDVVNTSEVRVRSQANKDKTRVFE